MNESMPDPDATDRDAPASPPPLPQDDEAVLLSLARAIGLACGHAFADMRTFTPGPNTFRMARQVLAYLHADRLSLIDLGEPITMAELSEMAGLGAVTSSEAVSRGSTEPASEQVGQSLPSCGNSQCTLCPPKGNTNDHEA